MALPASHHILFQSSTLKLDRKSQFLTYVGISGALAGGAQWSLKGAQVERAHGVDVNRNFEAEFDFSASQPLPFRLIRYLHNDSELHGRSDTTSTYYVKKRQPSTKSMREGHFTRYCLPGSLWSSLDTSYLQSDLAKSSSTSLFRFIEPLDRSLSPFLLLYTTTSTTRLPIHPTPGTQPISTGLGYRFIGSYSDSTRHLDRHSESDVILRCLDSWVVAYNYVPFTRHTTHKSASAFPQTSTTPSTSSACYMFSSSMVQTSGSADVTD
ncbi:uncharacterized protein HD556DRAFT_1529477 [Suillus plorans]|uniref:Uncharacterized protein n=1 Tax=Suillus plorans TaxID=116603 RepID=A0A9P7DDT3_9AGAM|nr:uncharacterized protein HD556DRAFT_1529477 [Suillus plorans]KAG1789395.1 hypothetical protein HD556DRAFT_1529477 [Suillus plorans]